LYHNHCFPMPMQAMPDTADRMNDALQPWWLRLLLAERRALEALPAHDERELWLAPAGSLAYRQTGTLDLRATALSLDGDLRADNATWPLREDSIDRVVLQHVLEVATDADAVLDEALRVLKPERRVLVLALGALGWTRCRLKFSGSGAPALRVHSTRTLLEALAARGCVDLRVSRVEFDGRERVQVLTPARMWSGLCLIEARKRRELPNVRRLRPRLHVPAPGGGWIARPSSCTGIAA
jgi:SAM-dependent methyltransferase